MLQNIPTHVIAGPLGAGKTSLIRHLLSQRPAAERWAVLINEFGQIGLDAALLTRDEDGIALGEVAGGCLCCVNGAPFQVGLGRLLRKARPDRLLIEPSGLGHPAQLLKQLNEAPWKGVLAVQPCVLVLDAQALAAGKPLPRAQQDALPSAGLLVLNKDELLSDSDRLRVLEQLPDLPCSGPAMPPCPGRAAGPGSQRRSGPGAVGHSPGPGPVAGRVERSGAADLPQPVPGGWLEHRLALAPQPTVRSGPGRALAAEPRLAPGQAGAPQ
ncbi:hypothetical protein PBOI14_76940 [Pseudomonas sp. Boi14]|nr:hypothetical protein PBOI14_76940 [Pseudomonas sp. Boi14]